MGDKICNVSVCAYSFSFQMKSKEKTKHQFGVCCFGRTNLNERKVILFLKLTLLYMLEKETHIPPIVKIYGLTLIQRVSH